MARDMCQHFTRLDVWNCQEDLGPTIVMLLDDGGTFYTFSQVLMIKIFLAWNINSLHCVFHSFDMVNLQVLSHSYCMYPSYLLFSVIALKFGIFQKIPSKNTKNDKNESKPPFSDSGTRESALVSALRGAGITLGYLVGYFSGQIKCPAHLNATNRFNDQKTGLQFLRATWCDSVTDYVRFCVFLHENLASTVQVSIS